MPSKLNFQFFNLQSIYQKMACDIYEVNGMLMQPTKIIVLSMLHASLSTREPFGH